MDTTTSAGTDGVLVTVVGLLGLCIFGLGIAGVVFFVYYRFAGGNIVDFFLTLLRGEKDEEKDKTPPVPPPPQLRDLANQSSFDNTLTQHMLNNEVKTGHAINTQYAAPYPPPPATGTYPAQNAPYPPSPTATGTYRAQTPYPPPANRPNTGYAAPNMGYPPPNRAAGQPPPSQYPPAPPPGSGYPPQPAAHSGYPSAPPPLPPAAPKRDPFGDVGTPDSGSSGLSAPQSAEYNRNQGYMPNPGEPDDFLGGMDDDLGI